MNNLNNLEKIFNIKNKVAVITGGSGYLCSQMAISLHELGVKIVILDINIKKADQIISKLNKKRNNSALALYLDSSSKKNFETCFKKIIYKYKTVDILINGAGINAPTDFFNIKESEWDQIFNSQLKGTLFSCQVFGKLMVKNQKGSIINISSASSHPPLSKAFAYSAAKAGIKNLSHNLAREFATNNVRVNAIRPGFFPTEWSKKNFITHKRERSILSHTPMNRYGKPIELISTIVWLSSDSSSFVTGAEIPVDGGFTSMTI